MLAQTSKDFDGVLSPNEHYVPWDTPGDAKKKADYYLDLSVGRSEAEEIAERGEKWVLERFLPVHQAKRMMEIVESENG